MGVASLVSEILLLSKTAKFPFRTMDYSPWSSKNLINRNWLKKFTQVGINVTCMYIDFGGRGLYSFGDTGTLKNGQISLSVMKKFNQSELAQKFMHVGIDVTYMYTDFGERDLFGFGDRATLKNGQFSLSIHGL